MWCGAVAPADEPVPSSTEVGIAEPPLRRVKTHEKPQKRLLSMYHKQLLLAHLMDDDYKAHCNSSYSQSTRQEPKARVPPVLTERFTVTSKPTRADHDYVCTCIGWLSRTANGRHRTLNVALCPLACVRCVQNRTILGHLTRVLMPTLKMPLPKRWSVR